MACRGSAVRVRLAPFNSSVSGFQSLIGFSSLLKKPCKAIAWLGRAFLRTNLRTFCSPSVAGSTSRWSTELRNQLKREQGFGWTVRERHGQDQLTRRWEDDTRSSVMVPIAWNAACSRPVLNTVAEIRTRMESHNLSLKEALDLLQGSGAELNKPEGALNWHAVAKTFWPAAATGAAPRSGICAPGCAEQRPGPAAGCPAGGWQTRAVAGGGLVGLYGLRPAELGAGRGVSAGTRKRPPLSPREVWISDSCPVTLNTEPFPKSTLRHPQGSSGGVVSHEAKVDQGLRSAWGSGCCQEGNP